MKRLERRLEDFLQHKAVKLVWLFIISYVFLFCAVSYLKYNSFSYNDIDLSFIERTFWNTIHGKFTSDALGEATIFNGGHLFLIIFLLAPLYAIYPHPVTLLFMQTIALALPSYFIYTFARRKLDASFAFYFALAYLLYPATAFINLFEFHLIAFAPLFLIPMFIFFDQRRFRPFILLMFLSLACKEDVSLVIFGLGVYALFKYARLKAPFIKKQDWKWIVVPLLSGAFWFILATQFIQPYCTPSEFKGFSESGGMLLFYRWLGSTPGEIIGNVFQHPLQILRTIFIPAKNIYLLHLFGPLAFLSLFGLREMVIVLFGLSESLLSQRQTHFLIYYQYSALVMSFIFISAVFGLRRLLQFAFFKRLKLYILMLLSGILLFFAFQVGPLFSLPFARWIRDDRDVLKDDFVDLVPAGAAVATSFELATRLTHRDRLFPIYYINRHGQSSRYAYLTQRYAEEADCLLIDFLDQLTYFGFYYQDSDIYLKDFLERYKWNVAYEVNNIVFLTKSSDKSEPLIKTIASFPDGLSGPSIDNGYIRLAGCQFKQQTVLGRPALHLDGYLQCQNQTTQRYILQLDIYSKATNRLICRHYFVAPDRIYPSKRWTKGEKIKISQNLLLPGTLQIEGYNLVFNFVKANP